MPITEVIDVERDVIVSTETFAVVRYDGDVDIKRRVHKHTLGPRGDGRFADEAAAWAWLDTEPPSSDLMHVETRFRTWEDPMPQCNCASGYTDDEGNTIHHEDCIRILTAFHLRQSV